MAPKTLSYIAAVLALASPGLAGMMPADAPPTTHTGFRNVGYYASWASYSTLPPQQIQSSSLTHLLYSFAGIYPDNGTAKLTSDPVRDAQFAYPGDEGADPTQDLLGNIKQLFLHKKANRNFKTLLTFGGWGADVDLSNGLSTPAKRQEFAYSSVQLMYNYGFDGIDIDWEYPESAADIANLVDVASQIRANLNFFTAVTPGNPPFYLSLAVPAGYNRDHFDLQSLNASLDFINLMTYDFSGTWSTVSGHAANLYPSTSNPASTPSAIDPLLSAIIGPDSVSGIFPRNKVCLGLPLYGHVFPNTNGLGQPYTQPAAGQDTIAYSAIPLDGDIQVDTQAVGAYRYDPSNKTLISFDTVATIQSKIDYIASRWLGGAMLWSLDQDRAISDSNSIVAAVTSRLNWVFGPHIEYIPNNLNYPNSQFRNIRNQMGTQTLSTTVGKRWIVRR